MARLALLLRLGYLLLEEVGIHHALRHMRDGRTTEYIGMAVHGKESCPGGDAQGDRNRPTRLSRRNVACRERGDRIGKLRPHRIASSV